MRSVAKGLGAVGGGRLVDLWAQEAGAIARAAVGVGVEGCLYGGSGGDGKGEGLGGKGVEGVEEEEKVGKGGKEKEKEKGGCGSGSKKNGGYSGARDERVWVVDQKEIVRLGKDP